MYPLASCPSMCLSNSAISNCVKGYMHPLMADGAPGLMLIAWSHGREGGSQAAAASKKTLRCLLYSCGIFASSSGGMLYFGSGLGGGRGCGCLMGHVSARYILCIAPWSGGCPIHNAMVAYGSGRSIIGSWTGSIHPRAQSMFGCTEVNHG